MKILFLIPLLFMAACSPQSNPLRLVNAFQYPELPPIEPPPDLEALPVIWDIPRDTTQRTVKNTTDCISVAEANRNAAFWARCATHPPISNSNIFIGLSQSNWEALQINLARIEARDRMWRARVDEVNRQREQWRNAANPAPAPQGRTP